MGWLGLRGVILGTTALVGLCAGLVETPARAACVLVPGSGSGSATAPGSNSVVNCTGTGLTAPITATNASNHVTVNIGDGAQATTLATGGATAVTVRTSSTITINSGASISATGASHYGAYAKGNGNTVTVGGGAITTSGSDGVYAKGTHNTVTVSGGTISTTGDHTRGASVFGQSDTLTINGGTISNSGASRGYGVSAYGDNNTLTINGGTISTTGADKGIGARLRGTGSTLTISGGSISTSGDSGWGVRINGVGDTLSMSNGTISTGGGSATGVYATGTLHTLTIGGGAISTTGSQAHGIYAQGTSNTLIINGGTISTTGSEAHGAYVQGTGNTLTINGGSISTAGNHTRGAATNGTGNTLIINGGTISTSGANRGYGASAYGDNNTITINGGVISTTGAYKGFGARLRGAGNTLTITNGSISTSGNSGWGVRTEGVGTTVTMSGGSISTTGSLAHGIYAYGGGDTVTISGGSISATGSGANAIRFHTLNGTTNTLNLMTGASIAGGIFADTANCGTSLLTLGGGGDGTLAGDIANFQALTKNDGGTWTLGGATSGTGITTTINAGTLLVNGGLGSSGCADCSVTVQNGGTLGGNGRINGAVMVNAGGKVAPGRSIGTLTVSGNYTAAAGSLFQVKVSPTESDKLVVTGTASLNGTVLVAPLTGTFTPNTPYTILTAGTLGGQFAGLTSLNPAYTFALGYSGGTVILTLLTAPGTPSPGDGGVVDGTRSFFTQSDSPAQGSTITFRGGTLKLTASTSLGRTIVIEATGGTIDANGTVTSLTGTITNAGNLTIVNSGAIGGAVQIGGTLTGGSVTVADGGTAQITGTVASPITVDAGGTLKVNGVTIGTLTVANLGILRGIGTIQGEALISGTLRPGNSPGTMTFMDSITQSAGSVLALDIDGTGTGNGAGNYSRAIISGVGKSYTIGSNVTIAPILRNLTGSATNTYSPPLGTRFAGVVQADGGIVGSFAALTQPSDGLAPGTRFDTVYRSIAIDLAVTPARFGDLTSAGLSQTANQTAVGGALDAFRPAAGTLPTGDAKAVFDALYSLDGGGIRRALDQIGGELHADAIQASLSAGREFGSAVAARQAAAREGRSSVTAMAQSVLSGFRLNTDNGVEAGSGGVSADPVSAVPAGGGEALAGWTPWARAFGRFGEIGGDGNAAGFDATTGGGMVGLDRPIGDRFRVGAGFGYARTELSVNDGGGRSSIDSYQAVLYGGYGDGPLFADASLGYAFDHYDSRRGISFGSLDRAARSTSSGHDVSASVSGGWRQAVGKYTVEPSVGLRYDRIARNGFSESDAGLLNLSVGDTTLNALRSSVGARVGRSFDAAGLILEPEIRLAWRHELLDRDATARTSLNGADFSIKSARAGRDTAAVGAGVSALLDSDLKLYVNYDSAIGIRQVSHTLTAGFKLAW